MPSKGGATRSWAIRSWSPQGIRAGRRPRGGETRISSRGHGLVSSYIAHCAVTAGRMDRAKRPEEREEDPTYWISNDGRVVPLIAAAAAAGDLEAAAEEEAVVVDYQHREEHAFRKSQNMAGFGFVRVLASVHV